MYCPCKFLEVQHQHDFWQESAGNQRSKLSSIIRLSHSLLKQIYLTIILLGFGRKSCRSLSCRFCAPALSSSLSQTGGTHSPRAANEHRPPCDCWRGWLPSTLKPGAGGSLAGAEIQGNLMQQVCSVLLKPAGRLLLQKLYVVWALEQRHEEDEAICSKGLLSWRFKFFPLHQPFSWTWCKSLPGSCHCVVFMPFVWPNTQNLHHCSWELWSN